jgi:hypothetical protein
VFNYIHYLLNMLICEDVFIRLCKMMGHVLYGLIFSFAETPPVGRSESVNAIVRRFVFPYNSGQYEVR